MFTEIQLSRILILLRPNKISKLTEFCTIPVDIMITLVCVNLKKIIL